MPAFGLVVPVTRNLSAGIGAYGIAGMGVDYPQNLYGGRCRGTRCTRSRRGSSTGATSCKALPARKETIAAIQNLDLLVSVDVLPAEICGWSDVVLPEASYLERDDDVSAPAWRQPFLALRQEVVPPLHASRPGWWIAKELAGRLGLAERARALWGSALLGPLFLVSGVSTGAAFMLLFGLDAAEHHAIARWDRLAIGLELALLALFLVGLSSGGADGRAAAHLLLGGRWTAEFRSLVVVAGLVVPLLVEVLATRLGLALTPVAPALVLGGGFALRWILVAAGQV